MNKLRKYREAKNLTQTELAIKSGISRTTIVDIENDNKPDVKVSTLNALSAALDTTTKDIFFND